MNKKTFFLTLTCVLVVIFFALVEHCVKIPSITREQNMVEMKLRVIEKEFQRLEPKLAAESASLVKQQNELRVRKSDISLKVKIISLFMFLLLVVVTFLCTKKK